MNNGARAHATITRENLPSTPPAAASCASMTMAVRTRYRPCSPLPPNTGLRQGITDRSTADLSVGYYTLDYAPTSGALIKYTDEYYTARIGLEAKIIRHLTGKIFYQLISRLSGVGGGINDNQAGVQLILSY